MLLPEQQTHRQHKLGGLAAPLAPAEPHAQSGSSTGMKLAVDQEAQDGIRR